MTNRDPGGDSEGVADREAWRSSIGDEVERNGLAATWSTRLADIVRVHNDPRPGDPPFGAMLSAWAQRDPEIAAHLSSEVEPEERALAAHTPVTIIEEAVAEGTSALLSLFKPHSKVLEESGAGVLHLMNREFQNWGRTVKNTPAITFVPTTKVGVENIVKWAIANDKRVRVAGYRHSWSSIFSATGDVLVSLLPIDVVEKLPAVEPKLDPKNQLQGITFVKKISENGREKALFKIGAGTTNEMFREWAVKNQEWTVPLNVIMVEITFGGSNGPICHGAGWRNETLSDLVAGVEVVNAKGELQVVDDPQILKAVAGCFGLLGVLVSLTLKLDPMTYARMTPAKKPLCLTIPPPKGATLPKQIDPSKHTQAELDAAWKDFVARCEQDYYAEWFWFPFQDNCWINTWKNDGKKADAKDYPGSTKTTFQEIESFLAQLMNDSFFKLLPGHAQASLMGSTAMSALPAGQTIVTPLIDALHFRRGIQNMRVQDMELEIPIPGRADDPTKPDWTLCQRAWWAAINAVYSEYNNHDKSAPMRVALEMRVMGGSSVIMAPQYGNHLGTCSIEVLTNMNVDAGDWLKFMQVITDAWDGFTDAAGHKLNVRPHWAKQWRGLKFRGIPMRDHLKTVAYKDRIPEFGAALAKAAAAGGVTLQDLKKRFSNPLLDDLFAGIF
ncbi:MAG: FAD-binding protein [Polyangiaceae bacterium]